MGALRSKLRWYSDYLDLCGRDCAVVRVRFATDACNREIAVLSATTAGFSVETVYDLVIA